MSQHCLGLNSKGTLYFGHRDLGIIINKYLVHFALNVYIHRYLVCILDLVTYYF